MSMIPRILHQIWLGPVEPPWTWMDTWRRMHPGWQYHLWREGNLPGDLPVLDLLPRAANLAGQSDILRYALLERLGGVYVDADSICLKPLDRLLDVEFFACWENVEVRPGLVANGFLGSQPRHPLMAELVARLDPGFPSWKRTGPLYLTEQVTGKPGITVYPSRYFLPVHHTEVVLSEQLARAAITGRLEEFLRGPLRQRIEDSYALHFWGTLRGYAQADPHSRTDEAAAVPAWQP